MTKLDKIDRAFNFIESIRLEIEAQDDKGNCILASLILRDFLNGIGLRAETKTVGVGLFAKRGEQELYSIACGEPFNEMVGAGTKVATGGWDGHLVVICKGWLIDPTFSQFRRPAWQWTPDVAFARLFPQRELYTLPSGKQKRVLAGVSNIDDGGTLFNAIWIADPGNMAWRDAPSALPKRRDEAVREMSRIWKMKEVS